jgi:hypothetical protein
MGIFHDTCHLVIVTFKWIFGYIYELFMTAAGALFILAPPFPGFPKTG